MIFNYGETKKEEIVCAICRERNETILSNRTSNGLHVRTVMCRNCGLIYINPRMIRDEYDTYYKYHYRADRKAIKGKEQGGILESNWQSAVRFGQALGEELFPFIRPGLVIDVGSSTGGVLAGISQVVKGTQGLGIEPSLEESSFARTKGVETITGLFEDVQRSIKEKPRTVLCVQSLNHLLDPSGFVSWAYDVLQPEGHIVLAVKNFLHQVRRAGRLSAGVQIDHPYMFTPDSLRRLLEVNSFEVVYLDSDEGKTRAERDRRKADGWSVHHIRIVGKKKKVRKPIHRKLSVLESVTMRVRFNRHVVRMVYLFKYSKKLGFLRRLLHTE